MDALEQSALPEVFNMRTFAAGFIYTQSTEVGIPRNAQGGSVWGHISSTTLIARADREELYCSDEVCDLFWLDNEQ